MWGMYVCEEPPTLSMMVPYFPYKDLFLFCSSSTWNRRHSSCESHESLTPFSHVILKLKWWGLSVRARNLRQLMTISHLIFYSNYGKLLPGSSSYFVWYFQHDMLTCFGCLTMMLSSDLSNKAIFSRIVDVGKRLKIWISSADTFFATIFTCCTISPMQNSLLIYVLACK